MTVRAEEDTVAVAIENRIAWVKFNRPEKRNCCLLYTSDAADDYSV